MDWKLDLYTKIAPAIAPHAIVASNTSGLQHHQAVRGAAGGDQAALLRHPLLQPAALHGAGRADRHADHRAGGPRPARGLRHHRARQVGGARQGHAELHRQPGRHRRHAGDDEGGRDLRPDATTWSTTSPARSSAAPARAPSAPPTSSASTRWRTSSRRCRTTCKDDPFFASYATPAVLQKLIDAGALGQKTGAGFYKKVGKDILRFDADEGRLRAGRRQGRRDRRAHPEEAAGRAPEAAARIEEPAGAVPLGDPARQLPLRRGAPGRRSPRARATSTSRCAGASAPARARSSSGRQAGWKQVAQWVKEDIDAGKALSAARRCRPGCSTARRRRRRRAHAPKARGAPRQQRFVPPSTLPVYQRQPFRESVLGASAPAPLKAGTEVFKNDEVRVWTLDGEVLIASITAKLHLISPARDRGPAEGASSSPRRSTRAS